MLGAIFADILQLLIIVLLQFKVDFGKKQGYLNYNNFKAMPHKKTNSNILCTNTLTTYTENFKLLPPIQPELQKLQYAKNEEKRNLRKTGLKFENVLETLQ